MQMRHTLTRYYTYAFLGSLQFTWTTWLAYVLAKGGNPGWGEAAFHLAIWLGEVPTGAVADLFGRRTSMLVGLAVGALSSLGYLLIHDTWTACLVLALAGLAGTFRSGADTALLYETAKVLGGPDLARKALARATALQMGALAVAPAMAGFLYQWHDWAPFMASGLLSLATLPVVWGMAERRPQPPAAVGSAEARGSGLRTRTATGWNQAAALWNQTRAAVRAVLESPAALALILFSWGYYTVTSLASQFGQAFFPAAGMTMAATGLVFTASRLLSAGGSAWAERLNGSGALRLLRLAPLGLSLAYLGMGLGGSWTAVPLFALASALDGTLEPVVSHQLNEAIPSAQRATILSLQSAGFSLMMAVAFPAASYLRPISRVYLTVGALSVVLAAVWMRGRRREAGPAKDEAEAEA